jgi:LAO/AO transport system kinase
VARATRESIVIVEAAGYDVVLVETVGVGQSETTVANMVDTFLVLMLARTGDSLQGIKKGVLELADVLAVNKADGDDELPARQAARELADALRLLQPASPSWQPPVLTCSGLTGAGLQTVWAQIEQHRATIAATGELAAKRERQQVEWMWAMVHDRLMSRLHAHRGVAAVVPELIIGLHEGSITPTLAASRLLERFDTPDC